MRIVVDTNVFISGIFWEGNYCSQIIDAWIAGKFMVVSSLPIIEELIKILKSFKIQMDSEMIEEWRNLIIENAILVIAGENLKVVKADPSDDKFFEAAIAGGAKYIISQDKHVLEIGVYKGIKVVSPKEYVDLFLSKI